MLFPNVQCVFAGNRKLANIWAQRWFAAFSERATRAGTADRQTRQYTLDLLARAPGSFQVAALTAQTNVAKLADAARALGWNALPFSHAEQARADLRRHGWANA